VKFMKDMSWAGQHEDLILSGADGNSSGTKITAAGL
jgi:hypothetical protein